MFRQKLDNFHIYCHLVRQLIRKVLMYPLWNIMFSDKDNSDLAFNECYDLLYPSLLKMKVNDYPKPRKSPPKATSTHTPDYYADPLSVIHCVDQFSNIFRLYFRRYFNKHRLMRQSLARKIKSFFKRWNDNMHYHLTLLFGLSNIRPANLYDAIFGSSSYRIH